MPPTYRFGPFMLVPEARRLWRDDERVPLTEKAFQTLVALVAQAGRTVDKDALMREVWPDTVVEEANLTQQIFLIRKALGEGPRDHRYVVTVPRRGYRFVAPISPVTEGPVAPPLPPAGLGAAPAGPALRLTLALSPEIPMTLGAARPFALAPDGTSLAYVGAAADGPALFVRSLTDGTTRRVAGSEGALAPFFSPDGRWIAFFARGMLWKVYGADGVPLALSETEADPRGGTWADSDRVIFAASPASPLSMVDANGGRPTPVTALEFAEGERTHRWPHALPGGREVLFTVARAGSASFDEAEVWTVTLATGARRLVQRLASSPCYIRTGHLLYMRGGSVMAVRFDPATARPAGAPVPVASGIMTLPSGAGQMAVSDTGLLACLEGEFHEVGRRLAWVRGRDETETLPFPDLAFEEPQLSPDERWIAVGVRRATSDIWIGDCEAGTLSRLTLDGDNFAPVWTPDGTSVTFSSNRAGPCNLYQVARAGGEPRILVASEFDLVPGSWTPDGATLLFTLYHPDTGADIWQVTPATGEPAFPLVRTRFNECAPIVSPDGRLVAFASDESGRFEVYVMPFPAAGTPARVSTGGGMEPVWSPDGRRLLYRSGAAVLEVELESAGARVSPPRLVAEGPYQAGSAIGLPNFDCAHDGRLLVVSQTAAPARPRELAAVVNWFAEVARRLG